jgi:hypothetical protein
MLTEVRNTSVQQRILGSELPIMDVHIGREQARSGDRDGGIPLIRKSVDDMTNRGQVGYYIPAFGVLVETLLDRGADGDVAEAEARIAGLAALPADGSVIRDVWVLRLRALLARPGGRGRISRPSGSVPHHVDVARVRGTYGVGRGDAITTRLVRR